MRIKVAPTLPYRCSKAVLGLSAGLLALLVCACTPAPSFRSPAVAPAPALASPAPTPTPTPTPLGTTADAAAREPPAAPSPASAQVVAAPPDGAGAPLEAPIEIELPYKLYERPRAEGAVYAAGQDEELARWNVGGTGDPSFISNRPGYHPGARVVVNLRVVGGRIAKRSRTGMSEARLLAQARSKGYWPIRICFENALRRDDEQHGETRIRVRIARSARVLDTRILDSELDEPGARCLNEVLSNLRFSAPMPHGTVTADVSIKLWPGDAPVPVNEAPPGVTVNNPGLLERKAARQLLVDSVESLEDCYRAGLVRDPGLWGRVQLLVEFDEHGQLKRVSENESRFPDAEVTRCIVNAVEQLELPKPRGGTLLYNQGIRLGPAPSSSQPETPAAGSAEEKPAEPPGVGAVSD